MVSKQSHIPICPKCGYDQSGEIATWESVCPVEGRCPECGLEFAWADVFDPSRVELNWNVEHARTVWQMLSRTPGTLLRLMIPFYYWRSVGVDTPVRLRALSQWILLMWVGVHLLVSIPYGVGWWRVMSSAYYGSLSELYQLGGIKASVAPFVTAVGSPFVYMWIDPKSGATKVGSNLYHASIQRDSLSPMLPILGMILIWMVVLLATPITRKQAKIRRAHVARAGLMSMIVVVVAFEFAKLAEGFGYLGQVGNTVNYFWARVFGSVVMPALVLWLIVFWATAIYTGWKVRPCRVLITLGSVASLLGGVVMLYVVWVMMGWKV